MGLVSRKINRGFLGRTYSYQQQAALHCSRVCGTIPRFGLYILLRFEVYPQIVISHRRRRLLTLSPTRADYISRLLNIYTKKPKLASHTAPHSFPSRYSYRAMYNQPTNPPPPSPSPPVLAHLTPLQPPQSKHPTNPTKTDTPQNHPH